MGGIVSSSPSGVKIEWMDTFHAMKLTTAEVILLLQLFNRLKCDNSTTINVKVLLKMLDIEQTRFTMRIFSTSRQEIVGQIDFYDFVVSIWRFCSLDKPAISVFAFDIFDSDGDYTLTSEEVQEMFTDLTGYTDTSTCLVMDPDMEEIRVALVSLTKLTWDRSVNIEDFKEFTKLNQMLLTSIYEVQLKLKLATLGEGMWENIAQRRILIQAGMNIHLSELMMLHSNRKKFQSLVESQSIHHTIKSILHNSDNTAHSMLSTVDTVTTCSTSTTTTTVEFMTATSTTSTTTTTTPTAIQTESTSLKDTSLNKRKSKNYKKNTLQLPKNLLQHCSS